MLRDVDGSYQLFGATIRVSSQFTSPCFNRGWTDECIGQFPVDDVILTSEQAAMLEQLLETFPEEVHIIDETCESCSANIFYINGRWETINSCASGSDAYWQAVAQLDTLINDLAGVER